MEPGTVVKLKSGGPNMTAGSKTTDGNEWFCQWFITEGTIHSYSEGYFPEATLEVVPEP
jgi:uncharacterized protein YodC (DUF2158 family)